MNNIDLMFIARFFIIIVITSIIFIMSISLYGVLYRPSLIKKIIALSIFSDAANMFAVLVGYRLTQGFEAPMPPILTAIPPSAEDIERFVQTSVDPLPQALVLTAVVINLASTAFLVALTLQIYRTVKSTDVRILAEIRGKRVGAEHST